MRWSAFYVMLLNTVRDPGALASVFIMPAFVFVIFAMIFSGTSGGAIDIKVAIADERASDASQLLTETILEQDRIRRVGPDTGLDGAQVRGLVRDGTADVGLIIRGGDGRLDSPGTASQPILELVTDPAREIAVSIFNGAIRTAYATAMPDGSVRSVTRFIGQRIVSFSPQQRVQLSQGIGAIRPGAAAVPASAPSQAPAPPAELSLTEQLIDRANARLPATGAGIDAQEQVPVPTRLSSIAGAAPRNRPAVSSSTPATGSQTQDGAASQGEVVLRLSPQITRTNVAGVSEQRSGISYYAAAVAIMFVIFSSITGAMTLLEERDSGLMDRLAVGPGGTNVLIDGKFAFLVVQSCLQIIVIYLVAWLAFEVDLPGNIGLWAVTTLVASMAAAGIGLAFVMACKTRSQAMTLANIFTLVVSAVGGSMVPRYLMPQWLQDLGWLTPNTWTLEAYGAIFWRGEGVMAMLLPWTALLATGLLGFAIARLAAKRAT